MKASFSILTLSLSLLILWSAGCRHNKSEKIQADVNKAYELMKAGENEKAVKLLLEAESEVDETVEPLVKVNLYTALLAPYYNSYTGRGGKSKLYAQKAIAVAREADSLQWLPGLLWNLAINTADMDSAFLLLSECRDLSDRYGSAVTGGRARRWLADYYFNSQGNREEGERILDSLETNPELEPWIHIEITMERATFQKAKGDLASAREALMSISSDKLSLDGKESKYKYLYNIEKESGRWESAMIYRDSLVICRDSINKIKATEKLTEVEHLRDQALIREEGKRRLLWSIGGGVVLLLVVVIFFLYRSRQMKARQVKLIEKISGLNLRLAELEQQEPEEDSSDLTVALIEKFRLTKEFFLTLPESALVAQLNMVPNSEDIPAPKLKAVTDSIIGNFSESFADLRQMVEALTRDDTLMCMLFFAGLRREVVEVLMKVSEDALRKRKSRIKQKLPQELFELFFSK